MATVSMVRVTLLIATFSEPHRPVLRWAVQTSLGRPVRYGLMDQ